MELGEEKTARRKDSARQRARACNQILFYSHGKQKLSMYIFNTLESCYCLLEQYSAYIFNYSACIMMYGVIRKSFLRFFFYYSKNRISHLHSTMPQPLNKNPPPPPIYQPIFVEKMTEHYQAGKLKMATSLILCEFCLLHETKMMQRVNGCLLAAALFCEFQSLTY